MAHAPNLFYRLPEDVMYYIYKISYSQTILPELLHVTKEYMRYAEGDFSFVEDELFREAYRHDYTVLRVLGERAWSFLRKHNTHKPFLYSYTPAHLANGTCTQEDADLFNIIESYAYGGRGRRRVIRVQHARHGTHRKILVEQLRQIETYQEYILIYSTVHVKWSLMYTYFGFDVCICLWNAC